jgi:hypothetical protein
MALPASSFTSNSKAEKPGTRSCSGGTKVLR